MANLVVTSTTNCVNVAFNAMSTAADMTEGVWNKQGLNFFLSADSSYVGVSYRGSSSWAVSFNGAAATMQVDSVNGVAPVSNAELYSKLKALLG